MAGRPHGDRDRDRILARAGGPDLEGRLPDDPVVAELEGGPADGDDWALVTCRVGGVGDGADVEGSGIGPSLVRLASPAQPAAMSRSAFGPPISPRSMTAPIARSTTTRFASVVPFLPVGSPPHRRRCRRASSGCRTRERSGRRAQLCDPRQRSVVWRVLDEQLVECRIEVVERLCQWPDRCRCSCTQPR